MSVIVRGGATNPAGSALPAGDFRCGFGWNSDGDIGAAIGRVQRRHHAGFDLRRGLGAAGFEISCAAGSSHAGLNDRPADRHPAVFPRGLDAERLRRRSRYH